MNQPLRTALSETIRQATGTDFTVTTLQRQSGGCINEAYLASDGSGDYFVKLNAGERLPMFAAEAAALSTLAATATVRVPEPVGCGVIDERSYLVLEALAFGTANAGSWARMGGELAQLHRSTRPQFGWDRDNTIGPTSQTNAWTADWPSFFREQRLRPQFERVRKNGVRLRRCDELLEQVDPLLEGHRPAASLLHGDLWSGNAGFLEDGTPVLYDPATYYGDRETDLAFSEFFGGFPTEFYRAYEAAWPLAAGYPKRQPLYNLYHVLNHAHLFGGGYAAQAQSMIDSLLD